MMQALVNEYPDNEQVQMRRVEVLAQLRHPKQRKALMGDAANMQMLLRNLLLQYPENSLFMRAYVQWTMRPRSRESMDNLELAARYARTLLADNPGSSEMLMLYIASRDRLSSALAAAGNQERATRENEMTLGVLSLIMSRADYTPEMRERLAVLVSMHPQAADARSQQEAEISLLLENHDEKRLQEVRERIQRIQRFKPHHGKRRHATRPAEKQN